VARYSDSRASCGSVDNSHFPIHFSGKAVSDLTGGVMIIQKQPKE
jgi:hypothetical protein